MNNIAVCIPTFKRPEMLEKLVLSIFQCNLNSDLIRDVYIIVVDNDSQMTAKPAVNRLKTILPAPFKIEYSVFPVKGLANVRNELLKKAFLQNPDYLIFVDDDEYVSPEWLNEMVKTIIGNNAEMVMGPVCSRFDSKVSEYIYRWIDRPDHPNNARLDFIRTGNLIIRVKSLMEYKIWFDERFNTTGGEDSYFGVRMIARGASVYWAAMAIVYEPVAEDRANLQWLVKRYYNGANIYTNILKIEKRYSMLMKKMLVSFFYIMAGAIAALLTPLPFPGKYWGILKLSEGFGGIAGLFSIRYHEYK